MRGKQHVVQGTIGHVTTQIQELNQKLDKATTATRKWKKVGTMVGEATSKLHDLISESDSKRDAEEADIARLNNKIGEMTKEHDEEAQVLAGKRVTTAASELSAKHRCRQSLMG